MATHYATTLSHSGEDQLSHGSRWKPAANVGSIERKLSAGIGLGLALAGLWARGRSKPALALTGAWLGLRGATGWCPMYAATGVNRADDTRVALSGERGVNVRDQITIRRHIETVYNFWRKLENLPRLIDHLESVVEIDETRSHWVAQGPMGVRVEWDAEIINDIPNRLIAWRSLEGSDLVTAGSVNFRETQLGTEVSVNLQYLPPAGKAGAALAWFFGDTPAQQLRDGLERLQRQLESI